MYLRGRQRARLTARQARKAKDYKTQRVWEKGHLVPGYDPRYCRQDDYGTLIYRYDYGNRRSRYGWEKDHIILKSEGGSDELLNLRPLHWYNNVIRQNNDFAQVRSRIKRLRTLAQKYRAR